VTETAPKEQYFIFRLADQIYGTLLSDVAEVIEHPAPKWVPHMKEWFRGVINLRGRVVGVIDLRDRFEVHSTLSKCAISRCSLVFETEQGPLVAMIDEGVAIRGIGADEIDKHPNIKLKVASNFIIGFASYENEVVALIKLNEILSRDELVDIGRAQRAI
jgi:purine-binding chemotaxis protein CheW